MKKKITIRVSEDLFTKLPTLTLNTYFLQYLKKTLVKSYFHLQVTKIIIKKCNKDSSVQQSRLMNFTYMEN